MTTIATTSNITAFPRKPAAPPPVSGISLDRLADERLSSHLTDVIAEMARRSRLRPLLRQMLAEHLSEMRAEALAGSDLTAEEIAAAAQVAP